MRMVVSWFLAVCMAACALGGLSLSRAQDGALIQNGMPRFDNLTPDQVHALWSYVRAAAREAKTAER